MRLSCVQGGGAAVGSHGGNAGGSGDLSADAAAAAAGGVPYTASGIEGSPQVALSQLYRPSLLPCHWEAILQ